MFCDLACQLFGHSTVEYAACLQFEHLAFDSKTHAAVLSFHASTMMKADARLVASHNGRVAGQ